jgi:Uma2 family endonuclease
MQNGGQSTLIPTLQAGDRLTRAEFERRYHATPGVNKAQLIEGIVYMPSPVRYQVHGFPHSILNTVVGYYLAKTPGLGLADNATVRLDPDNAPQPDLMLLLPRHAGGRAKVDVDDYISGSPELVCEVAGSSASIDAHYKKNAYRRNGVREYLLWRTEDRAVDFFQLTDDDYRSATPDAQGLVHSGVFPGLCFDIPALLATDLAKLLAAIDRAIQSPAHAQFVERLRGASA